MADATKFDPVPVTGLETLRRPDPLAGLPPAPPLDPPAAGPKPKPPAEPEPAKPTAAPPLPSNTAWVSEALGRLKPTGRRGLLALVGAASLGAGAASVKFLAPGPVAAKPDTAKATPPGEFVGPPLPPEPADQTRKAVVPWPFDKLDPPAPVRTPTEPGVPVALPTLDLNLPKLDAVPAATPAASGPVKLELPTVPSALPKLDLPDPPKFGQLDPAAPAAGTKPAPKPLEDPKPALLPIKLTGGADGPPGVKPVEVTPFELPKLDVPAPAAPAAPAKAPELKVEAQNLNPPAVGKPLDLPAPPAPAKAEPAKIDLPPLVAPPAAKSPEPPKVDLPPLGKSPELGKVELPKLDLSPITPGPVAPTPQPAPTPAVPMLDFGPPTKPAPVPDVQILPAAAPKPLELTPSRPLPPAAGRAAAAAAFDVDLVYPKAGDSYTAVSRRALGDDRYAAALEAHNRFARVDDLAADRRPVEVPPVAVLRKQYGAYLTRQPADAVVTPVGRTEPRPAAGGPKVYTVPAGGRTLKQIAEAAFGDENFWGRVYDENRGLTPDQPVPAGTRVRLPADARIGE